MVTVFVSIVASMLVSNNENKTTAPSKTPSYTQNFYVYPETQSTFKGYSCTTDCSGHAAGYNWAEKNGINNPYDCGGQSKSFIEGCEAYAEGQQPGNRLMDEPY